MNPPTPRRSQRDPHESGVIRLRELPVAIPACDRLDLLRGYGLAKVVTASWYNPSSESNPLPQTAPLPNFKRSET